MEIQNTILVKYKPLLLVNEKLNKIAGEVIAIKYSNASAKSIFSAYAIAKAYKSHKAAVILCRKGYGEDAAIISRSMFELLINFLYILKDDSDYRVNRYMDYDWILRNNIYKYAKTKESMVKMMEAREATQSTGIDTREKIEAKAKKVQEKYKYNNSGWSDKSLRDMSSDVGRSDEYSTIYKLHSQIAHNATRNVNDYLRASETGFKVNVRPSENWVGESLISVFDSLCSIVGEYNKLNKTGFEAKLDKLIGRWVKSVEIV